MIIDIHIRIMMNISITFEEIYHIACKGILQKKIYDGDMFPSVVFDSSHGFWICDNDWLGYVAELVVPVSNDRLVYFLTAKQLFMGYLMMKLVRKCLIAIITIYNFQHSITIIFLNWHKVLKYTWR